MVIVMETNFNCGQRIRQLRNERAISQEQLALTAGITPAYLGLVERGQRNATVRTVERICDALGVSLALFFSDADRCTDADDIDKTLVYQLHNLNREEKQLCLQLVKTALQLKVSDKTPIGVV